MRFLPVLVAAICLASLACASEPSERSPEGQGQRSPKTFTISNGDSVTYKPGVARPGDKIVCVGGGERSGAATVPKPGRWAASLGTGPGGSTDVSVSAREDGSVVASCKIW
jgi:hypothetical protein